MKRFFLAFFLLCSALAFGQATVTGHVSDISNSQATGTSAVQFDLVNCGQSFATISGAKILFPLTKTFTVTSGVFTGTLRGNDVINCGGTFNTYYRVTRLYNGVKVGTPLNYIIPDAGTWTLETANPVVVVPPDTVVPYATFKPRGAYLDSNAYGTNDLVQYGGSTWRAKAIIAAGSGIAPGTDDTKWEQWAAAGTGLADPGNTGLVKRTTAGITVIANASDVTDTLGFIPASVTDLATKATDFAVVHNTGAETVGGQKHFTSAGFFDGNDGQYESALTIREDDPTHGSGNTHFGHDADGIAGHPKDNYIRGRTTYVDSALDVNGTLQIKGSDFVQPISWNVENATTADSGRFQANSGLGGTAASLSCDVDTGKTATISLEIRSAPNTTGTDILYSGLVCSDAGASTTTFSTSVIPANSILALKITDSNAGVLRVHLRFKP